MLKLLAIILFPFGLVHAQPDCGIERISFSAGESLDYDVYYHWGLIWANAGRATFSVKKAEMSKKTLFHLVGEGSTHKGYDWFFKVRDTFQCWSDTLSLRPQRYVRSTREGSNRTYNDNYFNYHRRMATCLKIVKNKVKTDSVRLKECTFDVLSMIYYARCINYSSYKPGAKIPISLYLDGEINDTLYIRYLGEEKINTALGEKKCIVFSPLLISGTIFSGGEKMKVWVTNDEKKIPLLITTPIVVGEVQVKIKANTGNTRKKN